MDAGVVSGPLQTATHRIELTGTFSLARHRREKASHRKRLRRRRRAAVCGAIAACSVERAQAARDAQASRSSRLLASDPRSQRRINPFSAAC